MSRMRHPTDAPPFPLGLASVAVSQTNISPQRSLPMSRHREMFENDCMDIETRLTAPTCRLAVHKLLTIASHLDSHGQTRGPDYEMLLACQCTIVEDEPWSRGSHDARKRPVDGKPYALLPSSQRATARPESRRGQAKQLPRIAILWAELPTRGPHQAHPCTDSMSSVLSACLVSLPLACHTLPSSEDWPLQITSDPASPNCYSEEVYLHSRTSLDSRAQ